MSSPLPTLAACICYAYCSKVIGPRMMENRKPFEFRNILVVYNLAQTIFSAWIFYEMANTCWWYYFSKFTEFIDTLFFVLRKKNQHVSTLHVIHHGIMPMSVWFGLKFAP
ncbi:Elongation of very long chain fatty acids protein, partial [Operophtera brumata]